MKIADVKNRNCMWIDVALAITRSDYKQRFLIDLDLAKVVGKTIVWEIDSVAPIILDGLEVLRILESRRSEKEAETVVEFLYEKHIT